MDSKINVTKPKQPENKNPQVLKPADFLITQHGGVEPPAFPLGGGRSIHLS